MTDATKRRKEVSQAPTQVLSPILKCKAGPVDSAKLSDFDYREALIMGVNKMISVGRLKYDDVKA